MRKRWALAAFSAATVLTACGASDASKGHADEPPAGPPDGVLWLEYVDTTDLKAVWLGESRMYSWASTVGSSYWSPDRTRMLVEETDGKFAIVTAQGERHSLPLTDARAFAWSPDGARVVIGASDQIMVADRNGRNEMSFPAEPNETRYLVAWSLDGSRVALKSPAKLVLVDVGAEVSRDVPLAGERAPIWSPDSASVGIMSSAGLEVFAGDGALISTYAGTWDAAVGWSPDGTRLAMGSCPGELAVVTRGAPDVTTIDTVACEVRWSPTESRLAYVNADGVHVWSAADESNVIVTPFSEVWDITWSPDGTMLAVAEDLWGWSFLIDADDGTVLAHVPGAVIWNAVGTRFVAALGNPDYDHLAVSTGTGRGENITQIFDQADDVDWLSDGEHLGLTTSTDVFVVLPDGSELTRIGGIEAGPLHEWLHPFTPCTGCPALGW